MASQSIGNLNALVERLNSANHVVASTGAGVSKESGVPTFRGKDGLWNKYKPEELANVDAFLANPSLIWKWYKWRRELMDNVKPNPGHDALVEMEQLFSDYTLITQNIDNLHYRAGNSTVIELHGNIMRNRCNDCATYFDLTYDRIDENNPPRCQCGGLIRPDVIWFGEMLPVKAIEAAWESTKTCDVFFSLGTSSLVMPAASLPFEAKKFGAFVVEINPEPTDLANIADMQIPLPTGLALPDIVNAVKESRGTTE